MYRNLNDYELLYMVCEDDSFEILLKKYQPLIYKLSREYESIFKKFGYELDDLMQIGYIALYKASSFYNAYNETMFYTYFKRILNNRYLAEIRSNTTNKKETLNKALSYDIEISKGVCYLDLFSDKKVSHDYSNELIIFKNSMPFLLSCVFELFYNGYTKEEIGLLLDEKRENIRVCLAKIKEHALTYKSLFFS